MGLDPNSTENVKISDRVDLEIMTGVVGLLGGAMGVTRKGEGRKDISAVNYVAPHQGWNKSLQVHLLQPFHQYMLIF